MTSLALVLEWENAEGLEREEARRFLDGIAGRLAEFGAATGNAVQLVLVHDEDVDPADLDADLAAASSAAGVDLRLIRAPGARYYEKKSVGALLTEADVLVFGDSDCTYGPDWIELLAAPILAGDADLVAGSTRAMAGDSFMEKASTFAWFFPSEAPADPLHKAAGRRFFANNFAIRADLMRQVPVPRFDASRSHGGAWLALIGAAGGRILRVPEAIARHKQYDSFGALMRRAALLGRDKDFGVAMAGASRGKRLLRALAAGPELTVKHLRRLVGSGRRALGLPMALAILPVGLAFQWVAGSTQIWSAATRPPPSEPEGYGDLLDRATVETRSGSVHDPVVV